MGVGFNSPFHGEQVVNNEGSAMVSSVGAIWRKSGATLLLTQGEEVLTGAASQRLHAHRCALMTQLFAGQKKHVHYTETEDLGR